MEELKDFFLKAGVLRVDAKTGEKKINSIINSNIHQASTA